MIEPMKIGDVMKDGTVYAGISPSTKQPMYAASKDAPLFMSFKAAAKYAEDKGFRVPTKDELNVLFNNRAAIGGFRLNWFDEYWSSSLGCYDSKGAVSAGVQTFRDGRQSDRKTSVELSVRCVRS